MYNKIGDFMKAIIFDLDGTLWDTSDIVVEKWNEVLSRRCKNFVMTKETMGSLMGKNKDQFIDAFFVGVDKSEAYSLIDEIFVLEQEYLRAYGGNMYSNVSKTIKELKEKYAVMIVSNCQCGYMDAFLSYYGIGDLITDTECAGGTGLSKGENIRLVIERNGIEKAVYVGDTESDFVASKQAGLPFVYASYGFGKCTEYDATIDEFVKIKEVADLLLG